MVLRVGWERPGTARDGPARLKWAGLRRSVGKYPGIGVRYLVVDEGSLAVA